MPISNDEIPAVDHKRYCQGPNLACLYIRTQGYNDKKKKRTRTITPIGIICLNCRVSIYFPHTPTGRRTNKLKDSVKALPKILSEKDRSGIEEIEHKLTNTRTKNKDVQPVISPKEKKFRAKVKSLNRIYKDDCICYPILKNFIKWDKKLAERFLDVRPTFEEFNEVLNYPPLCRNGTQRGNKYRGWMEGDEFGIIVRDPSHRYIPHPKKPHTWKTNMDPNKMGDFEKIAIKEVKGRTEAMQNIIKKHLESNVQIYYPVQDEDKIKKKAKI